MTNATQSSATGRGIMLTVITAGLGSAVVNAVISAAAQSLGADPKLVPGLAPALYISFAVIGLLVAAVVWSIVRIRAAAPSALMRTLIPVVVGVSLIPDVLIGVAGFGWVAAVALMLMHLAVAAFGVTALRRFLPLPRRPSAPGQR